MALRILRNEAEKNPHCLSASEFGDFQRNAVKFSHFSTALIFWFFCIKAKEHLKTKPTK
jgi:hypothetical protein